MIANAKIKPTKKKLNSNHDDSPTIVSSLSNDLWTLVAKLADIRNGYEHEQYHQRHETGTVDLFLKIFG